MIANPLKASVVTPATLLSLIGNSAQIIPSYFGFTSIPETKVMQRRTLVDHLFYFVTRNSFQVEVEGKRVLATRGTFVWIMPGVLHSLKLPNKRKPFSNYFLRARFIDPRTQKGLRLADNWLVRAEAWPILPYFKHAVDALQSPYGQHNMSRVRGALLLMTAWILDQNTARSNVEKSFSPVQRRRLVRYLDLKISKDISPRMLAELMELSPPYFSRVFHRSFGMAPRQWIVQRRIQRAATLLVETELKAKEIAYQLGYSSRYFFSKQFKQFMGVGPKAYRKGVAG
jgi:AraC-like DNA-binding protein